MVRRELVGRMAIARLVRPVVLVALAGCAHTQARQGDVAAQQGVVAAQHGDIAAQQTDTAVQQGDVAAQQTGAATQQGVIAAQQGTALGPGIDPALLRDAGVDPAALRCNRENRWGTTLKSDADAGAGELLEAMGPALRPLEEAERAALRKRLGRIVFWRMVRAVLLEGDNNNLGVIALRGRTWTGPDGRAHPLVVFRSGVTPAPDAPGSCFRSLLEAGGVRHVVNLFDGEIPVGDLIAAEQRAAAAVGASYRTASDDPTAYGPWRELLRSHYEDPAARRRASEGVARLVRDEILRPGGAAPRGNVHIHCGGGMHRSGMIAGVIERCVNREPMAVVEAHYRYHVGWRDAAHPGGAEELNLRFIREFDCGLLDETKR